MLIIKGDWVWDWEFGFGAWINTIIFFNFI